MVVMTVENGAGRRRGILQQQFVFDDPRDAKPNRGAQQPLLSFNLAVREHSSQFLYQVIARVGIRQIDAIKPWQSRKLPREVEVSYVNRFGLPEHTV
jgi:hypothetical protein